MKFKTYLFSLVGLACTFSACSDDDEVMVPTVQYIELSETQKTVTVGESWQVTAKVTPADAINTKVTWSNLHPEVGTIDAEGNVSAVGVGVDSIFATVDNVKALCIMTVKAIEVDGITLNVTEKELAVTDELQLTATVSPDNATDKTVTWTSSAAKVASVDENGKVVALSEGEATITARSGKLSATCKLSIVSNDLKMNLAACALDVAETQELEVVLPPRLRGQKVAWKSMNEELVTVAAAADASTKATVTALKPGTAEVVATVGTESVTCEVTVNALEGVLEFAVQELKVEFGTTQKIALSVPARLEGKAIEWKSADGAIASVEADAANPKMGIVKGMKAGETTIQAVVEGESVACKVIVTKSAVLVDGTTATLRLNLFEDSNAVAAKIKELDQQGITTYKLIGDFTKLGKVVVKKDNVSNVFANTHVEVIDFSGIDAATLPQVENLAGEKVPGLLAYAFDSGKDAKVQLFASLKKVILPAGLQALGVYAFEGCRTLEELVAPGVVSIGASAFGYCPALKSVSLTSPDVVEAGNKAFPPSVKDATLYLHENNKKLVAADHVTALGRAWKEIIYVK